MSYTITNTQPYRVVYLTKFGIRYPLEPGESVTITDPEQGGGQNPITVLGKADRLALTGLPKGALVRESGLVAAWDLTEDLSEKSGRYPMTVQVGPGPSFVGGAAIFDGETQITMDTGADAITDLIPSGSCISYCGWFKVDNVGTGEFGGYQLLMGSDQEYTPPLYGPALFIDPNGHIWARATINYAYDDVHYDASVAIHTGITIESGAWFWAGMSIDVEANTVTAYVLDESFQIPLAAIARGPQVPITVGMGFDQHVPFTGSCKYLRVWSRCLLESEITAYYNGGVPTGEITVSDGLGATYELVDETDPSNEASWTRLYRHYEAGAQIVTDSPIQPLESARDAIRVYTDALYAGSDTLDWQDLGIRFFDSQRFLQGAPNLTIFHLEGNCLTKVLYAQFFANLLMYSPSVAAIYLTGGTNEPVNPDDGSYQELIGMGVIITSN